MKKFPLLIVGAICLIIAAIMMFLGVRSGGLSVYKMPNQIVGQDINPNQRLRVGGLLVEGSVTKPDSDGFIYFTIAHENIEMPAKFKGIPPALFTEGKETIVDGWYRDNIFVADKILAKHDEDYTLPDRHKQASE